MLNYSILYVETWPNLPHKKCSCSKLRPPLSICTFWIRAIPSSTTPSSNSSSFCSRQQHHEHVQPPCPKVISADEVGGNCLWLSSPPSFDHPKKIKGLLQRRSCSPYKSIVSTGPISRVLCFLLFVKTKGCCALLLTATIQPQWDERFYQTTNRFCVNSTKIPRSKTFVSKLHQLHWDI